MSKTRYASDVEDSPARQTARAETERADGLARNLSAMRSRILQFHSHVQFVVFADADTAPAWAENWLGYILDGTVPVIPEPPAPEAPAPEAPAPAAAKPPTA